MKTSRPDGIRTRVAGLKGEGGASILKPLEDEAMKPVLLANKTGTCDLKLGGGMRLSKNRSATTTCLGDRRNELWITAK